jgi:uncharacterized membrane protein (Fun14 family)
MDFNFGAIFGALGLGGVAGAVVGYALKKVAKIAAVFLGLAFILVQFLVYKGCLHWDASAVSSHTPEMAHAAQAASHALWKVLLYNLPFAAGFAPGFWLGFRKG